MLYKNNTNDAVLELERQRTGNYGFNYTDKKTKTCPCCGYEEPEEFYILDNKCIGCSSCIKRIEYEDYEM